MCVYGVGCFEQGSVQTSAQKVHYLNNPIRISKEI